MKRNSCCVLVSVMILFLGSMLHAQTGVLYGTIAGYQDARVVDAVVHLSDSAFFRSSHLTDSTFSIPDLPAGVYTIKISAHGFMTSEYDIRIAAGYRARVALMLVPMYQPAEPSQQCRPASAPLLRTRSRSISGTSIQRSARISIQSAMALNSGVTTAGVNGISVRCCRCGRPLLIPTYEAIEPIPSIDTASVGDIPTRSEPVVIPAILSLEEWADPPTTTPTEPSGSPELDRRHEASPLLR